MDLTIWLPTLLLLVWFVVGAVLDPRRFGLGLVLTAALGMAFMTGIASLISFLADQSVSEMAVAITLAAVLALVVLLVSVLGVFLIVNTFTMWRKEGLGVSPLLSGGLGVAVIAYVALTLVTLFLNLDELVNWVVLLGLPAAYLAFLFVSFLLYSVLYGWATRHFGGPVDAIVVLGAGLGGGERVTPLLAGRIDRGRKVYDKSLAAGRDPVLVVSGGRGEDELKSEAEAMAGYLLDRDFEPTRLILEDASTDTEENLEFSSDLITVHSRRGNVAVATSDYHAFRAAIIMRKAKIPGYTVGCRTARYYWPSATVREFFAIILEHSKLNLFAVILLSLPVLLSLFSAIRSQLGL